MAFDWTRRALLGLVAGALATLVACGSGTIESKLTPNRLVIFGDSSADVGQAGGARYTVNDTNLASTTANVTPLVIAADYNLPLTASAAGGTGFAIGNARIVAKPDAAGSAATPTVQEQITAFVASRSFTANDVVVVSAGYADIIAQTASFRAGAQTSDQLVANVRQAARDLAAQVIRLVNSGAEHVAVIGVYDLGKSPWAAAIGQQALLSEASSRFNQELLVSLVDQGRNVLYIDSALLVNLMAASPAAYGLTDVTNPVCNSVDPGAGIGIGTGQVNSAKCTTATLVSGGSATTFLFADPVYLSVQGQVQLGNYAFTRIRERW
jgi:phospholipase/lecithinase/hemolysin